ncbi:MAG: DUF1080 domain-containing protein [Planctomycetaceae bacterium]|jgi:beta-glucanase (GH16 family)|nr:DUF1080 domain-containing protein [Planctomycetaceae bacterium]
MKKQFCFRVGGILSVALTCFVYSTILAAENVPNTLSSQEKEDGFLLLFDGEKLSPEIWQGAIDGYPVEKGAIVCRKGGNLLTKKEYANFVFRFEFLLPPGGNNGVGLRAESPSKDAAYHGMESQVLDNSAEKYKNLEPGQYHGSIYKIVPAKRNPEKNDYQKPIGEWNTEEITADGSRIKVVLNGETIVDADIADVKAPQHPGLHRESGFVGFLGHGDPVQFRNIRIKELPASEDANKEKESTEKKAGWKLTWEDNFDGNTFDASRWSKIPRGKSDWNNYMSNYDPLYEVKGGELLLRGIKNDVLPDDPVPFLTGGLYTKDKVGFGHGRLEIRAKLGKAKGAWPAFWLLPFDNSGWPDGGEIDIMERLNGDSIAHQTVHSAYTVKLKMKEPRQSATGAIDPDGYNIYAVELYSDKLEFFINDKHTFTYPRIETDKEGQFPFDRDFYLLLDMQLGGSWVGEVEPADLPVEMRIDWVRFYVKEK